MKLETNLSFLSQTSLSLGGIWRQSPAARPDERSSLKSNRAEEISFPESHSIVLVHSKCLISFDSHSKFCVEIAVHLFKTQTLSLPQKYDTFHHCHALARLMILRAFQRMSLKVEKVDREQCI